MVNWPKNCNNLIKQSKALILAFSYGSTISCSLEETSCNSSNTKIYQEQKNPRAQVATAYLRNAQALHKCVTKAQNKHLNQIRHADNEAEKSKLIF